jgi:hypothetical protein
VMGANSLVRGGQNRQGSGKIDDLHGAVLVILFETIC